MYGIKFFVLIIYISAIVIIVNASVFNNEKRAQALQFKTQGRYGRAGGGTAPREKHRTEEPNKFYLGVRFGKRSRDSFDWNPFCEPKNQLICKYTGVSKLYWCGLRKEMPDGMTALK